MRRAQSGSPFEATIGFSRAVRVVGVDIRPRALEGAVRTQMTGWFGPHTPSPL